MFRLLKFVSKKNLFLGIFLNILVKSCFIATPFVLGKFVNAVTDKDDVMLYNYMIISIFLFVLSQILMYFNDLVIGRIETQSYITFFRRAVGKIFKFDEKETNIDSAKLNQEFGQNYELIKKFFSEYPIDLVVNIIYILSLSLMLISISIEIAMIALVLIPLFIIFTYLFQNKFEIISVNWIKSLKNSKKFLVDNFNLRNLLRENRESFDNLDDICEEYKVAAIKRYRTTSFFENVLSYSSLNLMILAVNLYAGYKVYKGVLTIGEFTAIGLYISHLWSPIEKYVLIYTEYLTCNSIITSFCDFFDSKEIIENKKHIDKISLVKYSLPNKINTLSKVFEKGKVYIIVGDNGAGKTTLFTNIIGASKRYKGDIYINNELKKNEHYKNILFFNSEVYESDFFKATSLSDKSMGEKKLFYLRLLKELSSYDVYLLDEPTNYLQNENKIIVKNILKEFSQRGKIVIVSSHDEMLIKNYDFEKIYI